MGCEEVAVNRQLLRSKEFVVRCHFTSIIGKGKTFVLMEMLSLQVFASRAVNLVTKLPESKYRPLKIESVCILALNCLSNFHKNWVKLVFLDLFKKEKFWLAKHCVF